MLKDDRVNLVLALLIAICLWAYVLGSEDPATTDTVKNIPINYINEKNLTEDGLVVLYAGSETVNISYSGKRSVTGKVKASDFKVTVDLEGLKVGENTVIPNVIVPENISLKNITPPKIKVTVDYLVNEEKNITVSITNQTSDDSEPHIVQVNKENVKIEGAKTIVDSIAEVKAEVDAAKVGSSMKALNIKLVPVNSEGEEVTDVDLEFDSISVIAVLYSKKTVNLNVPIKESEFSYITRNVSAPKTITIKGTDEQLSQISTISCEQIDISDIFEDTVIDLIPILPDGIEPASESEKLKAKITVIGAEVREFTFTETDIVLEGVNEDMIPTVDKVTVTVKISGNTDVVEAINESDFNLTANVEGLETGEHTVPLNCVCVNNLLELEYNPSEIKIVIESNQSQGED